MICAKPKSRHDLCQKCVNKIDLVAWRPSGLPQGWRPEAAASTASRSYATGTEHCTDRSSLL